MGASSGPDLVTSGLELYLDAGNPASYSGSGTTWRDISGNGRNGTLQGSPVFSQENMGYFTLNGSTQYISTSHTTNYTTSLTACCWAFTNSTQNATSMLVSKTSFCAVSQSDFPFIMYGGASTTTALVSNGSDFSGLSLTGTSHGRAGNWGYFVTTYTTSSLTIYCNGVQVGNRSLSSYTLSSNAQPWTFGRAAQEFGGCGASNFTGRMASVKLYSRALTAAEVYQNYVATRGRYGL